MRCVYLHFKVYKMRTYSLSVILISFGLLCYVADAERCGSRYCRADQVCEEDIGGGTCFDRSSKKVCSDDISYCYKPTQCCGEFGSIVCCKSGTKCCGFGNCCSTDSGYEYEQGESTRRSSSSTFVWSIFLFVAVFLSCLGTVARISRRRVVVAVRCPPATGRAVLEVPVQSQEHYGYNQPTNHATPTAASVPVPPPYTAKSEDIVPPPPYYEVAN